MNWSKRTHWFQRTLTSFEETTHVVDLQESTIKANARFFENEEDVPRQAISMGIASIMAAKSIVLMAYGESKAEAIKGMVEGEITEDMPASILQNMLMLLLLQMKQQRPC